MKSRLMAAVLMMMSFGAAAPAAVVVVARPYVAVRVAPVVVYAAPVYPVYPAYGVRMYGGTGMVMVRVIIAAIGGNYFAAGRGIVASAIAAL
jgi:hypothetical protein